MGTGWSSGAPSPSPSPPGRGNELSLYLHIPFCDVKCAYCDFNSYAGLESLIPSYTRALCQELRLWAPRFASDSIRTVFFGGGTPSLTPLPEVRSIVDAIRQLYALDIDAELSLEANPGTVDTAYLRGLIRLGINRLSLGVQSFDDQELKALDRIHTASEAVEALAAARTAGFQNVNLDLIYGLASQTLTGWRANVIRALSLRPEHLSLYALTVEEGTALFTSVRRGTAPAPDADLQADMYELAQELLESAGYVQYEISNWALPGYACRHNLAYWHNARWLGAGAGAHSSVAGYRFSNALSPQGYVRRVEESAGATGETAPATGTIFTGMVHVVWSERVDELMAMSDTAILGLRLLDGVSLTEFRRRHGCKLLDIYGDEVRECVGLKLLTQEGDRLRLTRPGLLLANEVFSRLLPKPTAV
ncbi:MAG TPA: radical SAM family heme chaperone HemW [Dehalococcoidia bacterium]|nr:radical SAM family heme chaperone HemW [Dehalococcoidia bacterium]